METKEEIILPVLQNETEPEEVEEVEEEGEYDGSIQMAWDDYEYEARKHL